MISVDEGGGGRESVCVGNKGDWVMPCKKPKSRARCARSCHFLHKSTVQMDASVVHGLPLSS